MADQYYDVYNQSQYNGGKPNEIKNTVGLVGFIMSIVSFFFCGIFSVVGMILSIMGITKSKELNGDGKTLSIVGLVLSILSIFTNIMMTIMFLAPVILNEIVTDNDVWQDVDNTVIQYNSDYNYGDY